MTARPVSRIEHIEHSVRLPFGLVAQCLDSFPGMLDAAVIRIQTWCELNTVLGFA
jgi:hypothetical protein